MVKLTNKEFPSLIIDLLKEVLENMQLLLWKILFKKSIQLALISRKPITSSGLSSLDVLEEALLKRDILSKEEVIGEIENTSSTTSSIE